MNGSIISPVIRLVGEEVESRIMSLKEALDIARNMDMDLVEISPQANPPVCKIMDYQKFLYELKKKQKEIKAKSAKVSVKEIRLGPNTDEHDFNFKVKHAIGFLMEGNKIKVDVFFKGRSIIYKEQGELMLLNFAKSCEEYGKPEQLPRLEGKRMIMIISPIKK
ncbi:MAG: translation initiation factor IF-3 [Bacteroidales bacterium]|nr:translation initiation factor IF-3 [Bacteroidales bacterium]